MMRASECETVRLIQARLSALALIVTTLVTTGAGVLGAPGRYDMCTAKQHDCGATAKIARCCCAGQNDSSRSPGPVEARTQIAPDVTVVPIVVSTAALMSADTRMSPVQSSPPPPPHADLPTLFASLLI